MQGAYGGLIIIIAYGTSEAVIDQDFYLITQDQQPILTNDNQMILVQEEEP